MAEEGNLLGIKKKKEHIHLQLKKMESKLIMGGGAQRAKAGNFRLAKPLVIHGL